MAPTSHILAIGRVADGFEASLYVPADDAIVRAQVGDTIEGSTVDDVTDRSVTFVTAGQRKVLSLDDDRQEVRR